MEDRFPIVDILAADARRSPTDCQWALFLRNHDELTLEMVTDEERDYMYRVYAQDPQARDQPGHPPPAGAAAAATTARRIELMNGLLFSLPGTPVLYYGDEIGMGDNIYLGDRNGVRTPMQWSGDRNAGFSRGQPAAALPAGHHRPRVPLRGDQRRGPAGEPAARSCGGCKRLIALRKRYQAFGRGTLEFLGPDNRKVLAFIRERHGDERILVVANLSRFVQCVELDLSDFNGTTPVELFGRTEFPLDRRAALPHHAGSPRLLLVLAGAGAAL